MRMEEGREPVDAAPDPKEDEPIYDETGTKLEMKEAVLHISEKYDSLRQLRSPAETTSLASDGESASQPDDLSEQDVMQVELFFQSQKTSVFVCPSLVNLYMRARAHPGEEPPWELSATGIPVLLLDRGETRARSRRRIQLVLAERGTGFMLWRDVIDNLSNYSAPSPNFHTLWLSTDHSCLVGLSFDNPAAASQLLEKVDELTSDPANISLSGPSSKMLKKNRKKKVERVKLPKKTDISQPCCFQHVTRVDLGDRSHLYSLSAYTNQTDTSL